MILVINATASDTSRTQVESHYQVYEAAAEY